MSTQQFTLSDISSALSRLFNLPTDHAGLAKFSGSLQKTVNEHPEFQKTGLHGSGFQSLAINNMPAELATLLDPAQALKALRDQAIRSNPYSAEGIAARAALGWDFQRPWGTGATQAGGRGGDSGGSSKGSLLNSSSGSGRVTSTSYTQELAGGPTYKALIEQGYKPAHVTSAIDYARHIGASEDMARKFIKMNQSSRENLHRFVDDMRKNPAKTKEEEDAKIGEYYKKNPGARKHLTPEDIRKIIRGDEKNKVELKGEQAPHEQTQAGRVLDNTKLGTEKQVETAHAATAAKLENNGRAAKDDLDVLEAGIKQAEKRDETKQPQQAKPPAQKRADGQPDKPKPSERQAARSSAPAPKVG